MYTSNTIQISLKTSNSPLSLNRLKSILFPSLLFSKIVFLSTVFDTNGETIALDIQETDQSKRGGIHTNWVSADRIAIEDLDGDDVQEFISVERKLDGEFTHYHYATVSTWDGNERLIEWQSDDTMDARFILIGNVANDHKSELVLFDYFPTGGMDSIQILGWDGQTYRTILAIDAIKSRLAELLDIDGDGVQELALVTKQPDAVSRDAVGIPTMLSIFRVDGSGLQELYTIAVEHEIRNLAIEDLNDDGLVEIVTYERSYELGVEGQIGVHTVDPNHGIVRHHVFNRFVPTGRMDVTSDRHWFLETFRCNNNSYLYVDKGKRMWKSVFEFRVRQNGNWSFEPVDQRESYIHNAAIRSTMVYSHDHVAYIRYRHDDSKYEFIPVSELQPVNPVETCD